VFEGFAEDRIDLGDASVFVRHGGDGPPAVLLHGHPRTLGHRRFALAGHDRGSYVALSLALDHPEVVSRLALLDCLPISEHLSRITAEFATRWWVPAA
jgi:haloacetate dehalogenase